MNRRLVFTLLAAHALFVSALPATDQRPTAASAEVWARTELYFGTSKSDTTEVTDTQFQDFIDQEVTTRFPDGLTLLTGNVQFRNSARVLIREKSHVLILFYPVQNPGRQQEDTGHTRSLQTLLRPGVRASRG